MSLASVQPVLLFLIAFAAAGLAGIFAVRAAPRRPDHEASDAADHPADVLPVGVSRDRRQLAREEILSPVLTRRAGTHDFEDTFAFEATELALAVADSANLADGEHVFVATPDSRPGLACPATVLRSTPQGHKVLVLDGTRRQRKQLVLALHR